MRVVIVGGYGAFGALTAKLLARDGHKLWLAGRRPENARTLAAELGASLLAVDLRSEPEALFGPAPDVVIDAAGPFRFYRDDPYRLPRLCIARGCHYLDLSDAAGFTRGIAALDGAARASGTFVLSGASSVPGLSSTIVQELVTGLDEVDVVDIAILPGNRAPRGRAVIESLVAGVGRPSNVLRGGQWREIRGWTDRRVYDLAPGLRRAGYFVDVTDISLLPERVPARSVMFRAGLELGVMNQALKALATLRRRWRLELPPAAITFVHWLSKALLPFGSDRGGMQVRVVGQRGGAPVARTWTLVAEQGEGPFVPGLLCRTLLRRASSVPPGARACLAEVSRGEVEDAMADLAITTQVTEEPCPPLLQTILGDGWSALAPSVQAFHAIQDVRSFSGRAELTFVRSRRATLLAGALGLPRVGVEEAMTLTKTRVGAREMWERRFGGRVFLSQCSFSAASGRYRERTGLLAVEWDLSVFKGGLRTRVRRAWALGVPLPQAMLPRVERLVFERDGALHGVMTLRTSRGGRLLLRCAACLVGDVPADHGAPNALTDAAA